MTQVQLIIWKNEYSVGIENIDNQHKTILNIINNLYAAKSGNEKKIIIRQSLDDLRDYTLIHLSYEERMLKKSGYTDFERHKDQHDLMRVKIEEFVQMTQNTEGDISFEVLDFLKKWWTRHIAVVDHKYIGCLNQLSP